MKRVITITLIITLVFWVVVSAPLVSSADTLSLTLNPRTGATSVYPLGTGRITQSARTRIYQNITPAVTGTGWSYRTLNYYYTNNVSTSGRENES